MNETLANNLSLGVGEMTFEVWLVGHPDKENYRDRCIWSGKELERVEELRREWLDRLYDVVVVRSTLTRTIIGAPQEKEPKPYERNAERIEKKGGF